MAGCNKEVPTNTTHRAKSGNLIRVYAGDGGGKMLPVSSLLVAGHTKIKAKAILNEQKF